ncbi:uncharacterized protein LOC127265489 isoform X1 [Andrographis paniculata]|uniref:uncharacterized protein LOC127265489 isoform X1 n=1 Tax=Andrographis paniculata TaxID=175694 RepID=UPI0021E7E024|nr:uncharacterized protein LOC127265489 isoform X1 [Andrographis paniculata]
MNPPVQNLESMLRESIKHFLTSFQNGGSDFSAFESIFFRLIQTMLDPPLETSWFYSAVTFHAAKLDQHSNPSARLLRVKDLMKFLVSCSNLSSASKKIALLAPVVCEVYSIVRDCRKGVPFVETEVNNLVDNIVNYVTMSAGVHAFGDEDIESDNVVCFDELVRVWVADRGGGECVFEENLKVFFPLLTDGTLKAIDAKCSIRDLVGIVLCEVFFLKLYLSLRSGMHSEDILKDTQTQVAQSIKGFRNCNFLVMLLKMLLEPNLPLTDLLNSEDAIPLRKVLYDAVMFADYSFYSGSLVQSTDKHPERFALVWLLVADRALQFARATSDETRTLSYLNTFCNSAMVAELTKWASIQTQTMNRNIRPNISTPNTLISELILELLLHHFIDLIRDFYLKKELGCTYYSNIVHIVFSEWLLLLEAQGIRVFDHSISAIHSISEIGESPDLLHRNNHKKNTACHETDAANKDQEMVDLSGNGIPPSNRSPIAQPEMGRKRKESLGGGLHDSPVKQIKLGFYGNSLGEKLSPFSPDNRLPCGVEVKSVGGDEDMELVG